MIKTIGATILCYLLLCAVATADTYDYESIAKRFSDVWLDSGSVRQAKMQGECLVGLKVLNFQKRHDFDPVAEWTNYRSLSLLEQFPPCTVLVMIDVARQRILELEQENE